MRRKRQSRSYRIWRCGVLAPLALWAAVQGVPVCAGPRECATLRHHGKLAEATDCYTKLSESSDSYTRAEAFWGLDRYEDANEQFQLAVTENPRDAERRVRWGRLFLSRGANSEAVKLFNEALEIDPDNAPAYVGLALAESGGFSPKAAEQAEKALQLDPALCEAQELLAFLALEDDDPGRAVQEADKAIAMSPEALDAMAVRGAIDWLNGNKDSEWMGRILKVNPQYGEAYAMAGHFFVLNGRYEEGIDFYRKALVLNPRLWEARSQLGVSLMRLGGEAEARKQLETCYENGWRSAMTVNSLRLLDSYKNFETFKSGQTILRLHKKEAEVLRAYFEPELERAIAAYQKKFKMKLDAPVQVEVYPDHEDFAVRTMGMPGLGALGATFGAVVAMDSPSGRPPGTFHWASTMWHELSHVYILTATHRRVPRWFSEGLAVYEETAVSPDWGDRLDSQAIEAIQDKKLLPVAQLDRGFVRPEYPAQVIVSYYQAGQICGYIAGKWGYDKLLDMTRSFADLKSTPEVIRQDLGMSPENFDRQFLTWIEGRTKTEVTHFADWEKGITELKEAYQAKKYDEVIAKGPRLRDWYPEFVEPGSAYELLAEAQLQKGNKAAAIAELEGYSAIGGRDPATIKRLAALEEEAGRPDKAAMALNRLIYIYPLDEELHRKLGSLWMAQNNIDGAIREFQALIAGQPLDQAQPRYELAQALQKAGRQDEAREQVLLALEAAPGYRPAQQLLLQLSK